MNDQAVCQWIVDRREELRRFIDQSAGEAKPQRLEVFKKLLAVNNAMVELFWEINIARDREHLDRIADPKS